MDKEIDDLQVVLEALAQDLRLGVFGHRGVLRLRTSQPTQTMFAAVIIVRRAELVKGNIRICPKM
jgi:hypothetical protein